MILSDLSIKRPVFAAVMMLTFVTLGLFSYKRLGVEMFPNVEFPMISIVTTFPGASPETLEREVSKRIEESVNQIAGVKHVFSTSREGVSTVMVQFQLEQRVNDSAQEVRAKIGSIRGSLPQGIEEPIIQKLDFNAAPVAALAVRSDTLTARELTSLVEKKLKKRFESVAGVGKVEMVGGQKREIHVELDPVRLDSLGLGVNDVVNGIKSENTNTPLGRLTKGFTEYPLRIDGKPERAEHYRQMTVVRQNGRHHWPISKALASARHEPASILLGCCGCSGVALIVLRRCLARGGLPLKLPISERGAPHGGEAVLPHMNLREKIPIDFCPSVRPRRGRIFRWLFQISQVSVF